MPCYPEINNLMEPLVSICCITYNHALYIRQCLDGFMMQKTDFSFEVLIHDDASTDGTADIIREYEAKYPDLIKTIYQVENQYSKGIKISATYNYSRAKGKYIALCEGDDYWIDPLKLQKQVDFMENHPNYSLCFHNAIIINEFQDNEVIRFNRISQNRNVALHEIIDVFIIPTASMFFRSDLVKTIPQWVTSIYSGDFSLALLLANSGKMYCFKDYMSVYRRNPTGMSVLASQGEYVCQQHLLLLKLFDENTQYKYHDIIEHKILYLNKNIKYFKLKKKFFLLPLIIMPKFIWRPYFTNILRTLNRYYL